MMGKWSVWLLRGYTVVGFLKLGVSRTEIKNVLDTSAEFCRGSSFRAPALYCTDRRKE